MRRFAVQWHMLWLAFVFALLAGAANPFQAVANAQLKHSTAQPLWATLWVYVSGLLGVLILQAFARQPFPGISQIAATPWWAWTGGLVSIGATFAGLMLAQRLGSGTFTGLSITASVVVSILLDHLGVLGMQTHRASPMRLAGALLMMAGVWLVCRF